MGKILSTSMTYRPEPLKHSFGFKGGALTELWQVYVTLTMDNGTSAKGESIQSVLWSDSRVFAEQGQQMGNELMLKVTVRALELLEGMELSYPPQMLDALLPQLLDYGREITGNPELRTTFVLNAMTGVDFALWKLWRKSQGEPDFDTLFHMDIHQPKLGLIPLLTYDTSEAQIRSLAEDGCFLFKIKIGSNPGGRNDPEEMLQWDCQRLSQIHRILSGLETPWTKCGHPLYYIDANGRYDSRARLERFLAHAESIGAKERIVLLEEPFAEDNLQDVRNLGILIAADESAHCASDARHLMDEYGYSAMALKPIAKTLSVSLQVLEEARKRNVPCFCADLTVNPTMVELNKRFAAGLASLPGVKIGVFETNGAQNYVNWDRLRAMSPAHGTSWADPENSCYHLNEEYFSNDGNLWKEENT
ncbi:MAG: hypothetical protein IJ960_09115 [Oscillospiraceae bacterium]|nr:hypothetical protein [Oscillospiraceae bacterium]